VKEEEEEEEDEEDLKLQEGLKKLQASRAAEEKKKLEEAKEAREKKKLEEEAREAIALSVKMPELKISVITGAEMRACATTADVDNMLKAKLQDKDGILDHIELPVIERGGGDEVVIIRSFIILYMVSYY